MSMNGDLQYIHFLTTRTVINEPFNVLSLVFPNLILSHAKVCHDRCPKRLPTRIIFAGRTKRCEPQTIAPANTSYEHTDSLWQTPKSYINYLQKVVVPDKEVTIARLNLPLDQKAIGVHDFH